MAIMITRGYYGGWCVLDSNMQVQFRRGTRGECLKKLDPDMCRGHCILLAATLDGTVGAEVVKADDGKWVVLVHDRPHGYSSRSRADALIWAESHVNGDVWCEGEPYRGIGPEPAPRDQGDPDSDAEPETGMKFDGEKVRAALLPGKALRLVAEVLTFGAQKYGDNNWRKMEDLGRYRHAMVRHLLAVLEGEDVDPESGKRHMAHIATNALFLLELED